MLKTLLKVFGVLAAVALIVALSLTWVVVRVVQADGPTIIVPAPAILGQAVLALTPARDQELDLDFDVAEYREPALEAIRELRAAPDAQLLRVERDTETVSVWKRGDLIAVEVIEEGETVKVNAPLKALEAFLEEYDGGSPKISELAGLIRHFDSGKAVEVRSADTNVDVWVW